MDPPQTPTQLEVSIFNQILTWQVSMQCDQMGIMFFIISNNEKLLKKVENIAEYEYLKIITKQLLKFSKEAKFHQIWSQYSIGHKPQAGEVNESSDIIVTFSHSPVCLCTPKVVYQRDGEL